MFSLLTDGTSFRAKMYDITQHKKFKAGTVFLILINCALLGVPVSVRCSVARAVKEPEGILPVHIKFCFFMFLVEMTVCQKIKNSANLVSSV